MFRPPTEFYTKEHRDLAQDWLRFAVCKVLFLLNLKGIDNLGFGYFGRGCETIEEVETIYSRLDLQVSDSEYTTMYR